MDTHNDTQHHSHQKKFLTTSSTTITTSITNDHSTMHTTIDNDTLGGSVNAPHTCTHQSPLYIYMYMYYFYYPRYPPPSSSPSIITIDTLINSHNFNQHPTTPPH